MVCTSAIAMLSWRRIVFDSLHSLSYPGIRATQKRITSRLVWPGINADVRRWTRTCIPCQCAKINKHTTTPLSSFPIFNTLFDVVHIDLVGPLPLRVIHTSLPVWINTPAGLKHSPSGTLQRTPLPRPSS